MFFATLISNYLVHKGKSLVGPFPHEAWSLATGQHFEPIIEIPLVTVGTALLLFSSLFVVLALSGAQKGNRKMLIGWLGATIALRDVLRRHAGVRVHPLRAQGSHAVTTNLFGSSFYTLTGFHGTHVTIGVIWLLTMFVLALRGKLPPNRSLNLEMAALYWHFVDVVWIIIFPVVYLIK